MVTKIFAQAQKELEKGCGLGKEWGSGYCGDDWLCPKCQAKLSQLKIDKEIAREMMIEMFHKWADECDVDGRKHNFEFYASDLLEFERKIEEAFK